MDDAGCSDKVMTDTAESDAAVSLEAEEESMGRKLKLTVEGQELSITPVSYTHLDVYKRQI